MQLVSGGWKDQMPNNDQISFFAHSCQKSVNITEKKQNWEILLGEDLTGDDEDDGDYVSAPSQCWV